MAQVKSFLILILSLTLSFCVTGCEGQQTTTNQKSVAKKNVIGGGCDGCDLIYTGMPPNINTGDTNTAWNDNSQKLIIEGSVFKPDNITPASGILIYYWHTDAVGRYPQSNGSGTKVTRHGKLRGWMKSDSAGKFNLYTGRPASYPATDIPAHIHFVVKEPGINEYYTDELVFDDDPLLTPIIRKRSENRGGTGIVKTVLLKGIGYAKHKIILGLNIPDHPGKLNAGRK